MPGEHDQSTPGRRHGPSSFAFGQERGFSGVGGSESGGGGERYNPEEVRRRVENLLRPGGRHIGRPAGRGRRARFVREIPTEKYEPESFFRELTQGGIPHENDPTYPGALIELPEVGTIGLRPSSGDIPYTLDVTIRGIRVRKYKFLDPGEFE